MKSVDLCIHAKWIIPIEPENTVYQDYSLVINQGKILDLLATNNCEKQYSPQKTVKLLHHALMPGLINSHTHLPMNLFRGLADDLPLKQWLNQYIWPAEKQFVNEDFVKLGSELAIAELLKGGVTCVNDMYFFPEVIAQTAIDIGIRAAASIHIMDTPCPWGNNLTEYWKKGEHFYQTYAEHPLITPTIAAHAPYTVSNATLKEVHQKQQDYKCKLNIHMHETSYEIKQSLIEYKQRPLRRLESLNILSPDLIAIHMVHLDTEDLAITKDNGINVVNCPASNLKLASGFCPVEKLLTQNTNVAIGTDGAASNNTLDLLAETRLTAILTKAIAQDPTACPAHTALTMATLNGAKALGIDKQTGSIKTGKMADIIAIDLLDVNSLPVYSPISQAVYATDRSQVTDVWVSGVQLVQNKELLTININNIKNKALAYQAKIQKNINRVLN